MKAKLILALLGMVACLTGCCTKTLLQSEAFNNHFEPAPSANTQLYRKPSTDDVLVVYDEEREASGHVHRKAFWLDPKNREALRRMKKPEFVSPKLATKLEPVPMEKSGTTNATAELWAELNPQGTGFTLMHYGEADRKYNLPVYRDKADEVKVALLLPGAVTADTALVAGTLGIFYLYYTSDNH